MNIAVIGTGKMGLTLAERCRVAGHEVLLGSRDPAGRQPTIELPVTTMIEAVTASEIVAFAFPWHALTDVLREVGNLRGKIVLDAINPFMSSGSLAIGHKTSAGEIIQHELPRAEVVKAFNHIHWQILADPHFGGERPDLFYCGDYSRGKRLVAGLAEQLGFRPIDAGPMKQARALEPLAYLWMQMAYNYGHGPDFAFKIIERGPAG